MGAGSGRIEVRPVARMEEMRENFMVLKDAVGVTRRRMVVRWYLKRRVHWEGSGFCGKGYIISYGSQRAGGGRRRVTLHLLGTS